MRAPLLIGEAIVSAYTQGRHGLTSRRPLALVPAVRPRGISHPPYARPSAKIVAPHVIASTRALVRQAVRRKYCLN